APADAGAHAPWAGRATLTRGLFKARAMIRIMRWVFTRNPETARSIDVDGVGVTVLRDHGEDRMALATVGNRILGASDPARLQAVRAPGPAGRRRGTPEAAVRLHERLARPGEDGWAYARSVAGRGGTIPVLAASFDVDPSGDLVWRAAAELPGPATPTAAEAL